MAHCTETAFAVMEKCIPWINSVGFVLACFSFYMPSTLIHMIMYVHRILGNLLPQTKDKINHRYMHRHFSKDFNYASLFAAFIFP